MPGGQLELDVQLATVNAGEAVSIAASDSLAVSAALLDLQSVLGMPTGTVLVQPSDSLTPPPSILPADTALPMGVLALPVAAAAQQLGSAQLGLRVQRRSVLSPFGINAGVEFGGAEDERGALPTVGLTLPLPFLNRNRGGIAEAQATVAIARAELTLAQIESDVALAQTRRARVAQQSRIQRDQLLVSSANRVAAMSFTSARS